MEVRHVKYFMAVAKTGNVTRAAKLCHVSQPALSVAVHKFEDECGQQLFARRPGKVTLTAAGEQVYKWAAHLVEAHDRLLHAVQEIHSSQKKSLSIGSLTTIAPFFLLQALDPLTRKSASIKPTILAGRIRELFRLMEESQIDLALVTLPVSDDSYSVESLLTEELILALPADHRLAALDRIRADDLCHQSWIVLKETKPINEETEAFLEEWAGNGEIRLKTDDLHLLLRAVASGAGLALVPGMTRLGEQSGVVFRSINGQVPSRSIAAIWRKDHQLATTVEEFLSHLHETAKEISRLEKQLK